VAQEVAGRFIGDFVGVVVDIDSAKVSVDGPFWEGSDNAADSP